MKAINTKYFGPTNKRPARMKAWDCDRNMIYISLDDSFRWEDNHKKAAQALCNKMGWHGKLHGGFIDKGMVWVFEDITNQYSFNI